LQWIARIHIKRNNLQQALAELHQANRLLQQNHNLKVQALIYSGFMEAFEKLNLTDSLLWYTNKYIEAHDAIERKAAEAQAEIVQTRLDNQNSILRIKSLHKEKRTIALMRNLIIVITLMGFAFGVLYYNRQRLKMKLNQQQALEARKKAEAEAASARHQLDVFTQHLLEKNSMVESLQAQLSQRAFSEEQAQTISALSQHTILTDADWDRFKMLFEKVYPGFFHQIKSKAPDITNAELRVAALSKLRITSKEAASLLGITHASVNKTRQRLRQRLELEHGSDLEQFLDDAG
jgi:hypothetical protein